MTTYFSAASDTVKHSRPTNSMYFHPPVFRHQFCNREIIIQVETVVFSKAPHSEHCLRNNTNVDLFWTSHPCTPLPAPPVCTSPHLGAECLTELNTHRLSTWRCSPEGAELYILSTSLQEHETRGAAVLQREREWEYELNSLQKRSTQIQDSKQHNTFSYYSCQIQWAYVLLQTRDDLRDMQGSNLKTDSSTYKKQHFGFQHNSRCSWRGNRWSTGRDC